jgi:hypothetical protein
MGMVVRASLMKISTLSSVFELVHANSSYELRLYSTVRVVEAVSRDCGTMWPDLVRQGLAQQLLTGSCIRSKVSLYKMRMLISSIDFKSSLLDARACLK